MNSVWQLLKDLATKAGITEIVINGPKNIFIERNGQFIQLNAAVTREDLVDFINEVANLNNKICNESFPLMDGTLPDRSRINIVCEPVVKGSPVVTIRRYNPSIRKFETSPNIFMLSNAWVSFFKALVLSRQNIVVAGGTGMGKTTFLNLLLQEIPSSQRVITIEDTLELNFTLPNTVRLEALNQESVAGKSVSIRDLVKNSLRMRPDRLVIGEVRGQEMYDLLQALNTGHEGSLTSIHANSPIEALSRMESLYLLSGNDLPYAVVRRQISTGIDFIIQISKTRNGERYVSRVIEITGMESNNILTQTIAEGDGMGLVPVGNPPERIKRLEEVGFKRQDLWP